MSVQQYDVLVVGGGMVGLAHALMLARLNSALRIAVVDKQPASEEPPTEIGLRVSALSPTSKTILGNVGAWDSLAAVRVSPYTGMHVWQESRPVASEQALKFDAAELGAAQLGYIVENDLLRHFLWRAAAATDSITLLTGAVPQSISVTDECVDVVLTGGIAIQTKLLVAADGANSAVRSMLDIGSSGGDYQQRGIVCIVESEKPHQETAWQRFLHTGPVALLPLSDGRSSVVWSCENEFAEELLLLSDAEFADRLTAATDNALGKLTTTTVRAAFPLAYAHAEQYCGHRFALIGDAAHRVHPLAGQGVNLGLLDAAALAETVAEHMQMSFADPGDELALRRYERWRRRDNEITLGMMNLLHRTFAGNRAELSDLGGRALGVVNSLEPLKRLFAEHALGRGGDFPEIAAR